MKKILLLVLLSFIVSFVNAELLIDSDYEINGTEIWTQDVNIVDASVIVNGQLIIEKDVMVTRSGVANIYVKGGILKVYGSPGNEVWFISEDGSEGPFIYCDPNSYLNEIEFAIFYDDWYYYQPSFAIISECKDLKVHNCQFMFPGIALMSYGTSLDFMNNLIYASYWDAIEVHMTDIFGDATGCDSKILFNTFDDCGDSYDEYASDAIYMVASEDPDNQGDNIGKIEVHGNIFTYCENALGFWGGNVYKTVYENGYYANVSNWNIEVDDFPVLETQDPYDPNVTGWSWYLKEDSNFVQASSDYFNDYPELSCTSVMKNHDPRKESLSLGAGVSLFDYSNAGSGTNLKADIDEDLVVDTNDLHLLMGSWLYDCSEESNKNKADIDKSGIVGVEDLISVCENWLEWHSFDSDLNGDFHTDFKDFAWVANYWQENANHGSCYDLNDDGIVNFADYSVLSSEWNKQGQGNPNVQLNVSGNPDDGSIFISCTGTDEDTYLITCFKDGKYIGKIPLEETERELEINMVSKTPGLKGFKVVAVGLDGRSTLSENAPVTFNGYKGVSAMAVKEQIDVNMPYRIQANCSQEVILTLKNHITKDVSFQGNFNEDLSIPFEDVNDIRYLASIQIDELNFLNTLSIVEGSEVTLDSSSDDWIKIIEGYPVLDPIAHSALMVISAYEKLFREARAESIATLIQNLDHRKIPIILLWGGNCSAENIKDAVVFNPYTKWWFHVGGGYYHLGDQYGPFIDTSSGNMWACLAKDFPGGIPYWYVLKTARVEAKGKSLGISLQNTGKIKIAFIDSCTSNITNIWAWCLGMYSNSNNVNRDQVFFGWKVRVAASSIMGGYPEWLNKFWDELSCCSGGNNISEAFWEAYRTSQGARIHRDNFDPAFVSSPFWGYESDWQNIYMRKN